MARVCLISHSHYPYDARIAREARALAADGHDVDVICLKFGDQPLRERIEGVSVFRVPLARLRGGIVRYLFEFLTFQIAATLLVAALHLRHRYAVIETTSLPDWLVFATIVPRLLGARTLLDLHECMPEYAVTKYGLPLRHPVVRFLSFVEQASIRYADFVTTCTAQMRERFIERGAPAQKIAVVLNSFDEERYDPERYRSEARDDRGFALITHGTVEPNYGLDVVVRAIALLKERVPGLRFDIYGDGTHLPAVKDLARDLGVADRVICHDWLPMDELLPTIAAADAGVVAVRRDAFRDVTLCVKMFDFVSMQVPVIMSRTRAVDAYFGDECFQMFESGDERDLARAIEGLYSDKALRARMVRRSTEVNEPYRWAHQRRRYVEIVRALIAGTHARDQRSPVEEQAVSSELVRET
jgi:glycosyltransferase involved in cell wall biosynthesis